MLEPFFSRLNQIDKIIEQGPENCDFSRDIEPLLIEYASTKYFFDSLEDPKWLDVLIRAGKFREVPEPLEGPEKGTLTYPLWPESRYLARMAEFVPDEVLELILQMPDTKNIRVHHDLVDAALKMPSDLAAKLVPKTKMWLESSFQSILPERLGELVAHLARGGKVDEALDLTRSLLAILPGSQDVSREPQTRIDTWFYEEILNRHIPDLAKVAEERGLMLFCDLLEDSIRLSQNGKRDTGPEDSSFIWRRAVEDHSQNASHGPRDLLVSAVRDTAELLVEARGKEILEIVEKRSFMIFKRIGLYLRRMYPDVDPEGTAQLVTDPDVFDDIYLRHELFHLLHKQFGTFPQETQHAYLDLVAQGIDIKEWLDSREQKTGKRATLEDGKQRERYWKYTKLWPIQEFLDEEWHQQFSKFKDEFGKLEHPDFPFYITTSYGDTSPKKARDLSSMEIDELITFLKNWRPSDDFTGPSREGLRRELTSLVTSEAERFAAEAKRFQELDPIYISALFSGLRPKKQGIAFPWAPVLDLCCWVMKQPREIPGYRSDYGDVDPGWVRTRMAIADMISFAVGPDIAELSFDLRPVLWNVLRSLTEDPDPTLKDEASYGELDPVTLSLNTVRGKAMHAVIRYALWVRRHIEQAPGGEERVLHGFGEMPEIREVLDNHLNHNYDPSLAIRAVYGQWLPWLILLDPDWGARSVMRIFPHEETLHILREAAWHGYINFCPPYDNVFELLQEEYIRAIELIGTTSKIKSQFTDPDKRLAEHLMTFYWRGKIDLSEHGNLLDLFYEKASDSLCGHAIGFVGHNLRKAEKDVSPEALDRFKTLWIRRIDVARSAETFMSHAAEISAFGWWFTSGKFEDTWAIEQLKEALKLSNRIESDFSVVERLTTLTSVLPASVIECLDLIIKSDEEGWHFRGWRDHTRTILATVLQSSDEMAQNAAEDLINYLGSQGHLDFRDLLPKRRNFSKSGKT